VKTQAETPYHEALTIARSQLPTGCGIRIFEVKIRGESAFAALVPNGVPLVFYDLKWWLACPLVAELLTRYANPQE